MLTKFQKKLLDDLLKDGPQNLVKKYEIFEPDSNNYIEYNELASLDLIEPAGGGKDKITKAGEKALNN